MSTLITNNIKNPSSASTNIILNSDGSATIPGASITLATAQTANNAVHDFTGIPSWAKRITVMMNGTSLNAVTPFLIQLGTSSGAVTSGYTSYWGFAYGAGTGTSGSTAGFGIHFGGAAEIIWANMIITNVTGNTWLSSHSGGLVTSPGGTGVQITGGGNVTLPGTLDRVRVTSVSGTASYDLGSVNIMYE